MGSSRHHADDFYNTENIQRVYQAFVAETFKKIVPPDSRMWMANGIRTDVFRRIELGPYYEMRLWYKPEAGVLPQKSIAISVKFDEKWTSEFVQGQADLIHQNEITDFIIKIMMVYAKKEETEA